MPDDLILEIRENFDYAVEYWREIREQAHIDMRYVSGDPWDPKERKAREDPEHRRPCLALDELNQYVNQLVNDIRQNKRSIKVIPTGSGANDKSAELRASIIRQIEYKSNAQAAYATGFEDAATRSYGYWRVITDYVDDETLNQELRIRRIPNPDSIYMDPDAKEADRSDMDWCFVIESMRKETFKRKYPRAEIKDFTSEHMTAAPAWIRQDHVQVAEYWKVEKTPVDLEIGGRKRTVEKRRLIQYITNGIEILEENEQPGRWIPIIPVLGKELYLDDGAGTRLMLMSAVRLARDPYMLYCYYRTCEAEVVGMTPKTPYIVYEGQLQGHDKEWMNANRVPYAYLEVKPITDPTGQTVLPLPRREIFEPPIQALELGAEAAKRAIQSAMGRYNTSVGRADTKATSGVAVKALDEQSDQGSFHFIDNYDRALEHTGRILNDLLDVIYDTPRDLAIRKPDESHDVIHVNEPWQNPKTGQQETYILSEGEHDVTISTGPSYQSQREEASAFLDSLTTVPALFARVADLWAKYKNLGAIGDEMAKRLIPPEFAAQQGQDIPPQAVAAMQQLQQQTQALNAYAQELEKKLAELQQEKDAKVLELQSRFEITKLQEQTKLNIAELQARTADAQFQIGKELEVITGEKQRLHELSMAQMKQGPENGNGKTPQQGESAEFSD